MAAGTGSSTGSGSGSATLAGTAQTRLVKGLGTQRVKPARFPSIGPADAPVTLALFSSPGDNMRQYVALRAQKKHPRDVRLIWIYNTWPDQIDDARLTLAAHRQGLFWPVRTAVGKLRREGETSRAQLQCDAAPLLDPRHSANIDFARLRRLGLDLRRLATDMQRRAIGRAVHAHWRIAQALDLMRPARWMGHDFLLINGRRVVTVRGAVHAKDVLATLERKIAEELRRARALRAKGTAPGRDLQRALALQNGAKRYVELVIDGRVPPRAAALVVDPAGATHKTIDTLQATARRAVALLGEELSLRIVQPGDAADAIVGPPPPRPPSATAWRTSQQEPRARRVRSKLARLLRKLLDSKSLAWGYHGWRRVVLVTRAHLASKRIAPLLALLRKNRFSISLLTYRRISAERRRHLQALPAISAVVEVDDDTYADLLLKELVRSRTRAPD
ncbi:MAG: hypothetical protein KC503_09035 [Myxococcales bacterium]|nr:hypothetical protein [Myxococcales bacterium]